MRSYSNFRKVTFLFNSSFEGGFREMFFSISAKFWFLIFLLLNSCSSESAPDCIQKAGALVREEVSVADFSKITVFENVGLVLKEGQETKVEVETGKNLINEIQVNVANDRLTLRNNNGCNFIREYGLTKVFVTAPNIHEIRSSTGLKIESEGVLEYPSLDLISESFINSDSETTDGEFDLKLNSVEINIVVNGIAYFKLRGNTEFIGVTIAAGDSRIEAQELSAQFVDVDHRGTNDILVKPVQLIKGDIRGLGNVIGYETPPLIQINELFKGKLIFID